MWRLENEAKIDQKPFFDWTLNGNFCNAPQGSQILLVTWPVTLGHFGWALQAQQAILGLGYGAKIVQKWAFCCFFHCLLYGMFCNAPQRSQILSVTRHLTLDHLGEPGKPYWQWGGWKMGPKSVIGQIANKIWRLHVALQNLTKRVEKTAQKPIFDRFWPIS